MNLASWTPLMLGATISVAVIYLSWSRWRSLDAIGTSSALNASLARRPMSERLEHAKAEAAGWAAELTAELTDSCSVKARLATAGELLADLDYRLGAQERLPRQLVAITLTGHALCLFVGFVEGVRRELLWFFPLLALTLGLLIGFSRRAQREMAEQREQAEKLIVLLIEDVIDEPMPQRRQMRWRTRRRR